MCGFTSASRCVSSEIHHTRNDEELYIVHGVLCNVLCCVLANRILDLWPPQISKLPFGQLTGKSQSPQISAMIRKTSVTTELKSIRLLARKMFWVRGQRGLEGLPGVAAFRNTGILAGHRARHRCAWDGRRLSQLRGVTSGTCQGLA